MEAIAIIGLAGRFPGADGVTAFWENLRDGVESISHFADADLDLPPPLAVGEAAQALVNARGVLADAAAFDAAFFGIHPREAERMDPQQRVFLECAWEAMEHAGYDPGRCPGPVGVWAGASLNSYLLYNLCADRDYIARLLCGYQQTGPAEFLGNEKDFLATRVSYKLDLRGPSLTVQTACSTSLVAVAQACQALLAYQCDMALAGGVSISFPQRRAYPYQEGGMASADGHTRTFDADAAGVVFGDGAGCVVLKRLSEARADGDQIVAVIRGTAVNNDGAGKVSYSAPSADGQAEVIQLAQALADVAPGSISYVEAHGTATPLGDPIELAGLTQAFRAGGAQGNGFCAIGSLKTNVGHLETAAGVAALIKTALALKHRAIPPSLHFRSANPKLGLENSPFYVNTHLLPWPESADGTPRRAGVSSFGVGGTNAHAVLEEAPLEEAAEPSARGAQLFVLSAKTESALDTATANLARWFRENPALDPDDAAFTLAVGRAPFACRRVVAARGLADAAEALEAREGRRVFTQPNARHEPPVAFLFPGQGAQALHMGAGLYRVEPVFRAEIDRCAEGLRPWLDDVDLRTVLYPSEGDAQEAAARLAQTRFTQPALFAFGYALARLWMSWGVRPAAMLGHSVGEYVAACLAGVFSLEDGLRLVAERARLVQSQPGGVMLAVRLPEEELLPLLAGQGSELSLAAVNSPVLCVVAGAESSVQAFEAVLATRRVAARRLQTSHAFHSAMLDAVVEPFEALVRTVPLSAPQIPFVSNVTGRLITDAEATDPLYWARHLRGTVRFADGVGELLLSAPGPILLEAGPGQTLAPLARQHQAVRDSRTVVLSTLQENHDDTESALGALGRLWVEGVGIDWTAFHAGSRRRRVPLPTYPFEKKRYWVEPVPPPVVTASVAVPAASAALQPMQTVAPAPAPAPPIRRERITEKIRAVLKNLSGQDQTGADPGVTFLELGFDSLFLTQVAGTFRKEFGVKVTFRQLLEDLATMDALAAHLDAVLPPDVLPAPAVARPAPPALAPAEPNPLGGSRLPVTVSGEAGLSAGGNSVVERVIQEQLRVMAQQLETLRGGGSALTPVPTANLPPVPAPSSRANPVPAKIEAKAFGPYRPIEKSASGGFTERQQRHLDALIAEYTARTPESKRLTRESRAHFSDPRTVSGFRQYWKEMVYPIVTDRSAGARLWDIDGHEYIDLTMGFGTNLLGHSPAFITAALEDQLKRGVEVGPQSPLAGKVAALLCEMTGAERAAFTNTGSEAVLAAVRLARTVTGRTRIATCGGFHGINDEVLVRANVVDGERRSVPVAPGIPEHIVRDVLVVDYGTAEGLELLRAHAHELAAILIEPVQSRRPDLQPRDFLHAAREIATQGGCALIFDEVITGFRCHPGGAQAYFGVQADLATWGKVMGGGMPVGALTGRAEYMDALDGGAWQYEDGSFPEVGVTFFAGTYIRHPLTLAASWAILNYLRREGPDLQRRLSERTGAMVGELNRFFADSGVPLHLENFASLFYPHFDDEIKFGGLMYFHLRAKGVHAWEGRPCFLSTAHTEADVAFIVRAFKETIREMQAGGFLPGEPRPETAVALNGSNGHHSSDNGAALSPPERPAAAPAPVVAAAVKPLQFSFYYFGNYPAPYHADKYRLILESARFADEHGFTAVWLPERHFHAVGGFSPNPSLLAAALARDTRRIALRGGSVVLPLHHPVRVAEEWSLVDNLSHGRVGISIASGWHPNDFIFAPERFERRREICLEDLATIRKLWRGEAVPMRAGADADFDVKLFPLPVQKDLPVWLTCIHEESFVKAGELGLGVLGYLMNQTVEEVAAKIGKYREALARHGHEPAKGQVTILVHTFLGDDAADARERARGPLREYLRSFLDNSQKRLESQNGPVDVADEDLEYLLNKSFNDYVQGKALIGTPESCAAVVERLRGIGVDEIGCFLDFGVDTDAVLASLPALDRLRALYAAAPEPPATGAGAARELPFTESQRGLWVLGQTGTDALRAYHESTTLALHGPLDEPRLREALRAAANRHEALRATIHRDGEAQVVQPTVEPELSVVDLSGLDAGERDAACAQSLRDLEGRTFDFERGPLLRAVVVRLAPQEHLLVLTFHHLLGNGPSYWVFLAELAALYADGRAALETPMQLGDWVRWRQEESARTDREDEAFWVAQFADGVPTLELPADHPRPGLRSHRGGRQRLTLDRELTAALRQVAAARRGSLFMLLLAAFEVLLHRLSGQDDLVVGVPFEGEARSLPGGEGLFANTTNVLPLRSRAGAGTSFADLFAAAKDRVLAANDHQNYFFGRLIKRLNLPHDPSRPPVFSVFFNYETGKFERAFGGGLHAELVTEDVPYRCPRDTAMFELYLNVGEKDGELHCECDHNADLFDGATVQRWLGHYRTLLAAAAADPAADVWALPLLDAAERRSVVEGFNQTRVDYPLEDGTLHGLIEAQARRTPQAVALIGEERALSYQELDRRANQLAHYLRAQGVGPETLVGVCMERSPEMVVALLGILKAGGAYVPLDPDYPGERLAFMLADAAAPILLTQERLLAHLPPHAARVWCLDRDWATVARASADAPAGGAGPDSLAYVIYTSGSTGQPKGAMNTHRGVCNRLLWMQAAYGLGADERVLQKTPFSFDVSVWEFFWPLLAGAALVLARPRRQGDSDYLAGLIAAQGVTTCHFVPPMLAAFLEEPDLRPRCRSLRRVICSGEALPWELQERFFEVFAGAGTTLHNLYGPTEAAVDVTFWPCRPGDPERVVPIGRPIANTQIYVLDPRGQPLPVGVPGELFIGGRGVGRGYLGRPELTAERFLPDPFSADPAARLYRTGDLARWRADGNLLYLGRLDQQVKLRGFRIELGEIETLLGRQPGVRECLVLAREDRPGERRLVAYVVGEPPSGAVLRDALRASLPEYMVPAAVVRLPALPLTPNGKVDRRALPPPDFAVQEAEAGGGKPSPAPETALEQRLAEIWRAVLGIERIGVDDHFFELGGDSLMGLRMVNRIRDALGGEHLSLVVVFEAPTVRRMAKALKEHYPAAVSRWLGEADGDEAAQPAARESRRPVDEEDVARMRAIIGQVAPPAVLAPREKNPPAVFILSPMRSGSTLLRIMLAGNPRLFSPPELQLLQFDTLAGRRDAFTGYDRYMQEGTVRALMQVHGHDLDAARAAMAEREAAGWTVRRFYRQLQDWVAPRMLVDKTPDYALDLAVLRRAEACFDGALYIHLARHPLGMIRSYEKGHFLMESPYRGRHDFTACQLAELLWLISHRNILEFLRAVPTERQRRVRFEDIVSRPQEEMQALSGFLGVDYDPAMARPYDDPGKARMTDGVHAMSPQVGDHNFEKHGALRAEVADQWRAECREDALSAATRETAAGFGYADPCAPPDAARPVGPLVEMPPQEAPRAQPLLVPVPREGRRMRRSVVTGD